MTDLPRTDLPLLGLPRGALAAMVTPLTAVLEPNIPVLIAHGRKLLAQGCTGLVMLATAGEANSLSLRQRLAMIDAAASGGLPMDRMIVGAGSCALDEAVILTRATVAAGAAGTLLLPPFYYRDAGEDGIFRFYAALIERVGTARLRVVLHHRPQASGAPITDALIARLKSEFGPVIAGVQNGAGDWPTTQGLIRDFPDLAIFSGTERFLLETLRAGGHGAISATLNLTAALASAILARVYDAATDDVQTALSTLRRTFDDFPTPQAQKEILAQLTGDPDWRHVLPPLSPLAPERCAELARRLAVLPAWRTLATPRSG